MLFNPLKYIVGRACIKTIKTGRINYVNEKRHKKSDSQIALCPRRELNPHRPCGPQDFKSCVSTSFTTRAILKKNPPSRGNMSGRPGSNRPPRPWQGRALPNELIPHIYKELKGQQK